MTWKARQACWQLLGRARGPGAFHLNFVQIDRVSATSTVKKTVDLTKMSISNGHLTNVEVRFFFDLIGQSWSLLLRLPLHHTPQTRRSLDFGPQQRAERTEHSDLAVSTNPEGIARYLSVGCAGPPERSSLYCKHEESIGIRFRFRDFLRQKTSHAS